MSFWSPDSARRTSRSRATETVSTWSSSSAGLVFAAQLASNCLNCAEMTAARCSNVVAPSPALTGASSVFASSSVSEVQFTAVEEPTPRGSKPMMS